MDAFAKKLLALTSAGLLAGCIYVNPWPDPGPSYNYSYSPGSTYGSGPGYGGAYSYNPSNGYASGYAYGPSYNLNFSYYGSGANGCCYSTNNGDWHHQHPSEGAGD